VFGSSDRAHYYGAFNHWEMAGFYAGALTVALAPLGLWSRRRERWPLVVVAVVAILLAFGDHALLHRLFFRFVPLYGALRCPTRALIMALLVFPILAADGLTWLAGRRAGQRTVALLAVAALVAVAVAIALVPAGRFAPAVVTTRHACAHLGFVIAAALVVIALGVGGLVRPAAATMLVALISLADLITISRGYVQPRPSDWAAGTERFTAVDWLLAQHPPGTTPGTSMDRFVTDWRGPFRLHNLAMTYGLEGAGGYESFTVWRYINFLYTMNTGAPYPHDKLRDDLAAGYFRRLDSPLADLLNIRWLVAYHAPAPHWIERFHPPPGAPPHAKYEAMWDPQLNVYENTHVMPRAFVVHHATVLVDDKAQARALTTLDPRADVILDAAPSPPPQRPSSPSSNGFLPASIVALERHRVVVEADTPTPGILVLADTWYPGWHVTVDGVAAPLLRADYALRGVALPVGHHVVTFTFRSRPTAIGLLLSALGLVALVAIGVIGRRRSSPIEPGNPLATGSREASRLAPLASPIANPGPP
jgi:hypothetical protein